MKLSDALRHSELKFKVIAESAVDSIFLKDVQRRYTYANKAMQDLLGLAEKDILGKRPEDIFDPASAERIRAVDDGTFSGKVVNEVRAVAVQGVERTFHTIQVPLANEQGDVLEICGIVRDVTEQKKYEDRLRASLKEKEILLKEVNHRVNNNIQMITSMISLQSRRADSPQARDVLRDIQAKVNSIGMIHKQFYQTDNSALINFGSYLNDLLATLVRTFDRPEIRVDLRCEELTIPVSEAIPLAIMINEMATNTIKHAFPERAPGVITITCSRQPDHILLVVGDSGTWRPAAAGRRQTEGLGLHIIREMTTQLKGTMTAIRQPETRYEIRIPRAADHGDD
jgi:PAS domain S-box-containing protein